MSPSSRLFALGAALVFTVAVSGSAIAAEPRPGLWNQTVTMVLNGVNMPQMPAIPPEVLAQMEAAGIQMPNMDFSQPRVTTTQTCITAEEIANRERFDMGDGMDDDCRQENLQVGDDSMSMDLVCTGRMNGTGRMEYVFTSDTHFSGTMNFQGNMAGAAGNMSNTIEGNWVSDDCGNVAP